MKPELVIPLLSSTLAAVALMVCSRRAQHIARLLELRSERFNAHKDVQFTHQVYKMSQQLKLLWLNKMIAMASLLTGVAGLYFRFMHHYRTAVFNGVTAVVLLVIALGLAVAELSISSALLALPAERD
ncbi:hypothetical protein ACTHGU_03870 [Chitinophagaceae bacterium MMS25-I14]